MPTVSNVNLILTTVGDNVTIRVDYDVELNKFERQLSGLGLTYHTHVRIFDFDGGDTPGAVVLDFFPGRNELAVTVGNGNQVLHESDSRTVTRASLQVDPGSNNDELKAGVRVHANEMFEAFTIEEISEEEVLLG